MKFPHILDEQRRRLLTPPTGRVRVVIDTDAKNEIDDQFALAWAFLSADRLQIEGVYAGPYSFQYRRDALIRLYDQRTAGLEISETDRGLNAHYGGHIDALVAQGKHPRELPVQGPDVGMELSYEEILVVFKKLGMDGSGLTFRGAPRYMTSADDPVASPATEHLIALAKTASPDNPLYVAAIGCPTNISSAIVLAPEIIPNIVVTWTSAFPTTANRPNYSFNMEQDMVASRLLFESGVPLVYLPGYHIGAQLTVSLPEMEAWVKGRGAVGDYLYWLYTHNPLHERQGITDHFGRTWIIWDLVNFAWMLNANWVPSDLLPAPTIGSDMRWRHDTAHQHVIREAYDINRDAIFRDFFTKLEEAAHMRNDL